MATTRRNYRFDAEPRGRAYAALIGGVAELASHAVVAVRDELALSDDGKRLLEGLAALGAVKTRASSWPGTELSGHDASVWHIPLSPEVVRAIGDATNRLYGWRQPGLPEDLAFVRTDGSTLLGTVAHEADGWLELSADEHAKLVAAAGACASLIVEASDAVSPSVPPADEIEAGHLEARRGRNASPRDRREELLEEVLTKHLPHVRGSSSELTRGVIDRAARERIAHAIARELIETGLGPNGEPNDRGAELERLLDEINRPNLER